MTKSSLPSIVPSPRRGTDLRAAAALPASTRRGGLARHALHLAAKLGDDHRVALRIADDLIPDNAPPPKTSIERVEHALADAGRPLSQRAIRAACQIRAATVGQALATLIADGRVVETDEGYRLADHTAVSR